ncbi:PEP-CTERM sorting domain-containing protein [Massilia sp. PAMC28688]|uniref:PEP-CTERM sorting domain-containing protein n=1 Tax=Massilia sp. PAMC28688 TaxID=2861283 RepID=UPI001C625EC5|nr:PEP-CTERM sorting domain-containing protein [Massilia sp. PAMC28688]QYF95390.1 PEP-CTERM sorting domain-containing protein [Massilia sp. PAMC28688]
MFLYNSQFTLSRKIASMPHLFSKLGLLKHGVILMAMACFASAANATLMTYTTSGTIQSGKDFAGNFSHGVAGRDLAGLHYSQSLTFDPSLIASQIMPPSDHTHVTGPMHSGMPVSTITIGDVSVSYVLDKNLSGQVSLINFLTLGDTQRFDGVVFGAGGHTADWNYVWATSSVYSHKHAYGLGLGLYQNWSYEVPADDRKYPDSYVMMYGPWGPTQLEYYGIAETVSMQIASDVPEPSSVLLLAMGIGLLAARRRPQA